MTDVEHCLTWILVESQNAPESIRQVALRSLLKIVAESKTVEEFRFKPEIYAELNDFYTNGKKKIEMIKLVRQETGLMLKAAKDFVERNWDFIR